MMFCVTLWMCKLTTSPNSPNSRGTPFISAIILACSLRCCQCGKPQVTGNAKWMEHCWWGEEPCGHIFCEEHGKCVGLYTPGGVYIHWCACHDSVCLPCNPDPWDNMEPDSDGFLDDGPPDVEWNKR
eukprot:1055003-Amphidinium_carterae.2